MHPLSISDALLICDREKFGKSKFSTFGNKKLGEITNIVQSWPKLVKAFSREKVYSGLCTSFQNIYFEEKKVSNLDRFFYFFLLLEEKFTIE